MGGLASIASRIEGYIRQRRVSSLSSLGANMGEASVRQRRAPTVLVVDDEDLVREMCRRALQAAGYTVMVASNGARALGLLMQGGVDAVVTDIRMPEMNGWELAGRIATMSPRPAVLFISGYEAHIDSTSFTGSLLEKPFRPEQLVSSVSCLLLFAGPQPQNASHNPTLH
jgi:CheY-like chemotaxis protein